MSESWKRIAALVTALGISSSEGNKSLPPEAPSKNEVQESTKESRAVPLSPRAVEKKALPLQFFDSQDEAFSEPLDVKDIPNLLKEFFPDLKEKSTILRDFAKTLHPNDVYIEQLGGLGIAVSRLKSAYEGTGPVDTEKILEINLEKTEEGDDVYTLQSGISLYDREAQVEYGGVPLFSFEEVNPTQESMHTALQKMIDAEAKFQETDSHLGNDPEENILKLQNAILKIDEFLKMCDEPQSENSPEPYIFLDARARAFLQSRRASNEELLQAFQNRRTP